MKIFALVLLLLVGCSDVRHETYHGHIKRSQTARNRFKRIHPCPATGQPKGACPGWVIDHIKPLACGGEDDPSNMQWQTVEDAKAKDRWERKGCETRAGN